MEDALGEPASAVHDLIVVGTAFGGEVIGQGEISSAFRWVEPGRKDDPREILEREGIRSTAGARAYSSQRLPIEALHDLRSAAEEDTDPAE
ncbi:hypothetical protein [Nocardia testacea]|uniref:Uncharacterized protein n=1 Tax=Nocardia testacea TaxID=248551 RepID=A0ABW7W4M8_9NOCA